MDAEALNQLVQIKWLLVVFVTVAVLGAAARILLEFSRSKALRTLGQPNFKRTAQNLLEKAMYRELLDVAAARCREAPGDAYAFWYHAYAAHGIGDVSTARQSMQQVGDLAPDWQEAYVEPFIRGLRSTERVDGAALTNPSPSDKPPPLSQHADG